MVAKCLLIASICITTWDTVNHILITFVDFTFFLDLVCVCLFVLRCDLRDSYLILASVRNLPAHVTFMNSNLVG